MRTRDLVLSFVTCVVLVSANSFLSCATSKTEQDEEILSELDQSGSDTPEETFEGGDEPTSSSGKSRASLLSSDDDAPLGAEQPSNIENTSGDAAAEVAFTQEASSDSARTASGSAGPSTAPVIPAAAFDRRGAKMNRFYFARRGDSAASVSELIYGNGTRARDLLRWNKSVAAGALVFYQSPNVPDDASMRSFYQERQVPAEEYQIRKGDWLSKVAAERFGSAKSWKEIAVTNGIDDADSIEVGQRIQLYPKDLGNFRDAAPPAAVAQRPQTTTAPAQDTPPPAVANPYAAAAPTDSAPSLAIADPAPTVEAAPFAKSSAADNGGMSLMRLLTQNLYPIVVFAGLSVLLLAYVAVMRRRRLQEANIAREPAPARSRAKRS